MKSRLYKKIHNYAAIVVILDGRPIKQSNFSAQPKALLRAMYKYIKWWKSTHNQNYKKLTQGANPTIKKYANFLIKKSWKK